MDGTERGLDPSIGVGWPGALTLLAQAAASSSPRHRATSCTLGSSRPSGGALPSAPKSYKESRGAVVRGQGQPRLSHCALKLVLSQEAGLLLLVGEHHGVGVMVPTPWVEGQPLPRNRALWGRAGQVTHGAGPALAQPLALPHALQLLPAPIAAPRHHPQAL